MNVYTDNSKVIDNLQRENAKLRDVLTKLIVVAKTRLPSQPALDEIDALTMAESALAKASGESGEAE